MKTPALAALIASVPVGAIVGMLFKLDNARARRRSRRSGFLFIAVGAAACCAGMSALVFVLGGFQSESEPADADLSSAATPAAAPAPDSAMLTWVAPRTKADGSALRDLAGFRIYYGTVSGNYSASITVSNPAATTYTVRALPAGTYYFVVKAYDKRNVESAPSAEVSKTIR